MTRYANVGLKRSYVQAGFDYRTNESGPDGDHINQVTSTDSGEGQHVDHTPEPAKKKRKRGRSMKERGLASNSNAVGEIKEAAIESIQGVEQDTGSDAKTKSTVREASRKKKQNNKAQDARRLASERRRVQRQQQRAVNTTCFACREMGHAARDCPKAISSGEVGAEGPKLGKQAVGICYRCGSKKHTLSRCKKPVDPENPLPFSSCFVCSERGHMASSCPKNLAKGIYPNGGCCKLCRETTHLAKDCALRKNDTSSKAVFVGIGCDVGADEDDFHTFKRKNAELDKEEKDDQRKKRKADVRVGAHSGMVKPFGKVAQNPKKVVNF